MAFLSMALSFVMLFNKEAYLQKRPLNYFSSIVKVVPTYVWHRSTNYKADALPTAAHHVNPVDIIMPKDQGVSVPYVSLCFILCMIK